MIQRYDDLGGCHGEDGMDAIEDGKYVKYEDHKAKVEKEIAELKEATRWRNVEDELPESKGSYLVIIDNQDESTKAYYTGIENRWEISSFVTHWMPLPKANQEGES